MILHIRYLTDILVTFFSHAESRNGHVILLDYLYLFGLLSPHSTLIVPLESVSAILRVLSALSTLEQFFCKHIKSRNCCFFF